MADNDNGGWEVAPPGAVPLKVAMNLNDSAIRSKYPSWPVGGTSTQLGIESNYNPTAVSPKGATGMAQVMPETLKSIEKQTGRKLDPTDINDSLFIHRYLMMQNLQRSNGDLNAALSLYNSGRPTPDNPETSNYVNKFDQKTGVSAPASMAGWEPVPKGQDMAGWEPVPKNETPKPPQESDNGILSNLEGLGMQAANFAVGGLEAIPIGIHAGIDGLRQGSLDAVVKTGTEDFQKFSPESGLNALGVDTSKIDQTAGYQIPGKALNFAYDTVPGVLGEGMARTGLAESGMNPVSDYTPEQGEKVKEILQAGLILSPLAGIPNLMRKGLGRGKGPSEAEMAARKMAGEPSSPGERVEPTFNQSPLSMEQALLQADRNSDALRATNADQAEAALQPTVEETLNKLREQAKGEQEGIITDSIAAQDRETGQGNLFANRVADFNEKIKQGHEFTQGDLFNDLDQRRFDQRVGEEARPLTRGEFDQTLENLANQEGTVFDLPKDRDKAFDRYLDTVNDKQGGLFDRPTIAENFVKSLRDQMLEDKVNSHPTIRRLQNQVDQITAMVTSDPRFNKDNLTEAQARLDKARNNIKNFFKGAFDSVGKANNGIIEMNMGLRPPQWMLNGIGAMLKAFHGMVFKTAAKAFTRSKPGGEFSVAKAIRNGVADFVHNQANKDWEVAKNQKELQVIKEGPLAKFDPIKEFIPDERPYEEMSKDPTIQAAPDLDSNFFTKNFAQGGQWVSVISKNPYVKWAVTHFQNAQKMTDYYTKSWLTGKDGLQGKMRALSSSEKGEIYAHMDKYEGERTFTDGELRQLGYNDKQIGFYRKFQEVMKNVLDQVNAARARAGMDPVDPRIAYMTSRFVGDFRSLVYKTADDGHKYVVGYIGHNFRPMVKAIIKHMEEENPGKYTFEEPRLAVPDNRNPENMFQGYMNALNVMSKNDADVKSIVDSYRAFLQKDASKMLQALQHAKEKHGAFGAEGKKGWESLKKNAEKGMQSQLTYAQNMIKWSHFQDAANEVKKFMSDDSLFGKQDNAKAFVDAYQANAIGHTQTAFRQVMNGILNGVADFTGVGPSIFRKMNNFQKSALLQMWLGFFRIPHAMLTLTQVAQNNPAFAQMFHDRGITDVHFWGSSLKGTSTSMKMAMEAFGKQVSMSPIERAISEYNKKNQVFAVNLKDHLTDINSNEFMRRWNHITEANIIYPELALRATTFSTWVHALTDAKMPIKEALGTAESLTRLSLTDYRPIERPLVFGKMGFLGDIASTLTRFKMNQLSQHMYFGKNALKQGDVGALGALLASSVAFAGVSGLMGFAQANFLYNQYTTHILGKPDTLKALCLRHLPDWANYGTFAQLGINMQGSYSNADTIPEDPLAAMFPTGDTLKSMVQSIYNAGLYHDSASIKKLIYDLTPTSGKGLEENYMFSGPADKNGNKPFYRPGSGELQSIRTPADQLKRDFAFHPIDEARNYDVIGQAKAIEEGYAGLRERDTKRLTDQMQNGGKPDQGDMQRFRSEYFQQHRGLPPTALNDLLKFKEAQALTQMQRARGISGNPSLTDIYHIQDINQMRGSKR